MKTILKKIIQFITLNSKETNSQNDDIEYTENLGMNNVLMTADSWSSHFDTTIISATGFPKTNEFDWKTTLLTEKQFLEYTETSTIEFSDKIISAFKELKYYRLKDLT